MNIVTVRNNATNCYLLSLREGWLLIDTGLPDTFSQFLQLLSQKDISVNEINYLLITHYHPDHAGLTQNLRDLGTNLLIHEDQIHALKELNIFYKKNPKANYKDIIPSNYVILDDSNSRDYLESIGIEGNIITTPGHSDDSISLVLDDHSAFTGDLPHYEIMEAYNDLVIEDSWYLLLQNNVSTVYPSHGDPYEISEPEVS